jgi:hypothetical protein
MAGGRPTKYKPEYVDMVHDYLAECQDDTLYDESQNKVVDRTVNLPKIEGGFDSFLGVATSTVYEWAKEYPEFSKALALIRQEQKDRLINNGLAGRYNPTIAKLVLSANHGMREGMDVTSDGEQMGVIVLPERNPEQE